MEEESQLFFFKRMELIAVHRFIAQVCQCDFCTTAGHNTFISPLSWPLLHKCSCHQVQGASCRNCSMQACSSVMFLPSSM